MRVAASSSLRLRARRGSPAPEIAQEEIWRMSQRRGERTLVVVVVGGRAAAWKVQLYNY